MTAATQRVLMASHVVPEPDQDSGSRRLWCQIEFLRDAGWQISFLACGGVTHSRSLRMLQQQGIPVIGWPKNGVDNYLSHNEFNLAILSFWQVAELLVPAIRRASPKTRVIVDSLDVHFLREARRQFTFSKDHGRIAQLNADYASQLLGEMNTYAAADAVLTVSQKEADLLNDFAADCSLGHLVPDCEEPAASHLPLEKRRGMLFVGGFRHSPNVDAVRFLCKDVLPLVDKGVLEKHPVYIVGSGMDESVRKLAEGCPNVRMVGWVPSVTQYYEQAAISITPLRFGAGTKRKVVQALMMGTPSVTTSVGAEGLNLVDGEHALIADDAAGFARAITRLLSEPGLWDSIAGSGRELVQKTHGRETACRSLLRVVDLVMSRPAKAAALADGGHELYKKRMRDTYWRKLVMDIAPAIEKVLPADAKVAVFSGGSEILLELGGIKTMHFPRNAVELLPENLPKDAAAWLKLVEEVQQLGASYLLVPEPHRWFLRRNALVREPFEKRYPVVFKQDKLCEIYRLAAESAIDVAPSKPSVEVAAPALKNQPKVKLIAFYLPQFHPIPENDRWWGPGFTEWRNVGKAQPLFVGHYQPRLPGSLGFYDLRSAETREAQVKLASSYGIYGFAYYHFWFRGKRLLERPFNEVLSSGNPRFPFCLCWANEPWTRRWDGREKDILQPQEYSDADDIEHMKWLAPALRDPRAIRIEGKPVFMVYNARALPSPVRTAERWRKQAKADGVGEIYLISVGRESDMDWDATHEGFDAKVLFQPQLPTLSKRLSMGPESLHVYDYHDAWQALANRPAPSYRHYETVCPSWDNSARLGAAGWVLHNSSPGDYQHWLAQAVVRAMARETEHRLVFINAWNEWAEGAHLEPDARYGLAYLEATKRALAVATVPATQTPKFAAPAVMEAAR